MVETSHTEARRKSADRVPLTALCISFLIVSLCGFGGGLVWARRIAVDQHRWISEQEFADIVSLCQFMPGPNMVGIAVCIGTKLRGLKGAIAAVSGFVLIPWTAGFAFGALLLRHTHLPVIQNILSGVSAAAAGLLIGTGIRMLIPYRDHPAALCFAALAFGLMTFSKLPLLVVLLGLLPLSIAAAGIGHARAQ